MSAPEFATSPTVGSTSSSDPRGVNIGDGSVVGAGSVVTSDVPPHSVAAGNPCRVIGRTDGSRVPVDPTRSISPSDSPERA